MSQPSRAFVPDFERFDLDLTVEVYRQRRILARRRLRSLLYELDGNMGISPTLRGLGSKLAKFKHDVEYDAAQLSSEIDTAQTETQATFANANSALAAHRKDLEDVKSFVAEVTSATNGGPALDPPEPASAPSPAPVTPLPEPPSPLASGAPVQTQQASQ